jgi:hypothetical protein
MAAATTKAVVKAAATAKAMAMVTGATDQQTE